VTKSIVELEELRDNLRFTGFLVAAGFTLYTTIHLVLFGRHTFVEPDIRIAVLEMLFFSYVTLESVLHWINKARKHAD
jgi:hypothetical protein